MTWRASFTQPYHVVEVAHVGGASDGGSDFVIGSVASKVTVAAS
jgi:hypothetical protein